MAHDFDRQVRACQDCHDPLPLHAFLPQAARHFFKLACESCHIPDLAAPARSETDWTMLAGPGQPRLTYRGATGTLDGATVAVDGYQPILLPRNLPDGKKQLVPANLVTSWFWVEDGPAGPRPVPLETLERAFLMEGDHRHHRPSLVARLDRNGDGKLTGDELVLDSESKVAAVRALVVAAGARAPRIRGEIQPYPLAHGIVAGRFAIRACSACHGLVPSTASDFMLSPRAPAQVVPALVGDTNVTLPGSIERKLGGRLVLRRGSARLAPYLPDRSPWGAKLAVGVFIVFVLVAVGVAGLILLGHGHAHDDGHG
jgi:mono/diheme cytochrome c family protein